MAKILMTSAVLGIIYSILASQKVPWVLGEGSGAYRGLKEVTMYQLLQKYFNILTTSADVLLSSDLSHTKFEFLSQHFPRM